MSKHADIASLPFEKALAELEQIVREANPLREEGREPALPAGGPPLSPDWEH